jgi:hypothetical protein
MQLSIGWIASVERVQRWITEDDKWIILYTTTAIKRSPNGTHDGKFAAAVYKRMEDGDWKLHYFRAYRRRKDAKKRALIHYAAHSPKWAARNREYLASL